MFKNRKLVGLMISLAVTVLMGSVYLLSLQLMDPSEVSEEEQGVQEEKQADASEHGEAEGHHGEHESEASSHGKLEEKTQVENSHAKSEPNAPERVDKKMTKSESAEHGAEHSEHAAKSEHGKAESHSESASEEGAADLSKKYRPRIIGRCKVLYERFNKMELQANQFHSFAYSFDGKSGYCADSGPQTSMKLAKEIALSDCEKNKGSAESYAPCFIYSSEK